MSLNVRQYGIGTHVLSVALGDNDSLIILFPPEKDASNSASKEGSNDCCMMCSITTQ